MSDEISIPISLPLDEDGFLRRECPTCEREFKCLVSQDEDDARPAPPSGYHCPYCSVQAPPGSWWTKAQVEAAQALAYQEVVGPELEKLRRSIDQLNRSGGGLFDISAKLEVSDEPEEPPMDETGIDDMHRCQGRLKTHPLGPVEIGPLCRAAGGRWRERP